MRMTLLMTMAWPVAAQQVYSLAQLADSARRHLPLLLEKQALLQSARAGIREAKDQFLPQLNAVEELSIGTDNDMAGPYLPVPGVIHPIAGGITSGNESQPATANMVTLYSQYELVNFGLRGAKIAAATAYASLAQADLDREQYRVAWEIGRIYFAIRKSYNQLAVDAENMRRYQSMYSISLALTGSGVNPGVDSSLAMAGLARTRINYNEAIGNLGRLRLQLSYLTGIAKPEITVDTSFRFMQNPRDAVFPDSVVVNPLEDYFAKEKFRYSAAQELARKSYLPKVMVGAGGWMRGSSIQYSNDYKPLSEGLGYQRLNYLAGVGVTYDLFNGVHKRDRVAVLNGQIAAADYDLQQEQSALNNQEMQADESLHTAKANLAELPLQLKAARDAYNQKLAQYQAGIINLVDVANAEFELFSAQSNYITTLDEWYRASLDKAAATGHLDQFISTFR